MSGTAPAVADAPLDEDDILLTDAEREAMAEDDEADDGEKDGADTPEGGDGDAKGEASETAPPAKDPPAPAAEAPAPPTPVNVPLIRAEDTAAATARLEAIGTEAEALATRFDDGEMTAKEYHAALKVLDTERRDLDWSVRKAALSAEVAEQQATQAWFDTVNEFIGEHAEIQPGTLRWVAFDAAVREVTGDEANANLTSRKKLEKAYEKLNAELGGGTTPAAPKAAASKAPPAARPPLPPNLSNIPASAVNNTDENRYAALDRLMETNPAAYEQRLAQMSEAEQDAYLAAR